MRLIRGILAFDSSKQALLGTVISLFDAGFTVNDLSGALLRLPIWHILVGASDNTSIATYLLTNVNGPTWDQTTHNAAVTALNTEGHQGDWLAALMLSAANQTHVGLVGLATTGLVFS